MVSRAPRIRKEDQIFVSYFITISHSPKGRTTNLHSPCQATSMPRTQSPVNYDPFQPAVTHRLSFLKSRSRGLQTGLPGEDGDPDII